MTNKAEQQRPRPAKHSAACCHVRPPFPKRVVVLSIGIRRGVGCLESQTKYTSTKQRTFPDVVRGLGRASQLYPASHTTALGPLPSSEIPTTSPHLLARPRCRANDAMLDRDPRIPFLHFPPSRASGTGTPSPGHGNLISKAK